MDEIRRLVNDTRETVVNHRRTLHRIPELAFEEHKTAAYVAEKLQSLELAVQTGIAQTGVVAELDTGRAGPVVMLRADMDALPIRECTELEFCSEHEGCMHACGHDAHMAILLTVAQNIVAMQEQLYGRVRFVFQPAEEYPGGAKPMVEEGVMQNPDVEHVLGLHVWPSVEAGKVAVKSGPVMAAMDRFDITIVGRGGHAAKPHECVDALETGTQVIGAMQRIVSRMTNPIEPVILTVGEFHSGTAFNIIPGEAHISGTLRCFSPDVREQWEERLRQVTGGVCAAMGAEFIMDFTSGYPPVINSPAMANVVTRAAAATVGPKNVQEAAPSMGGEDIAYFFNEAEGCFFFLGCGYEDGHTIHHPEFDIDEKALSIGVEVMCRAVADLLRHASAKTSSEASR